MEKRVLSVKVLDYLKHINISIKDVISYSDTDLGVDGTLCKGVLLLTRQALICLYGETSRHNVFIYSGEDKNNKCTYDNDISSSIIIPLDEIEKLEVSINGWTGIVYVTGKKTQTLAAFTCGKYSELLSFKVAFDKLKRKDGNKLLTEADIETDKKHVDLNDFRNSGPKRKVFHTGNSTSLRLFSYLKPHKWKFAASILCYILISGSSLVWPYLNGTVLYDQVLKKNPVILERLSLPENSFVAALGFVVIGMVLARLFSLLMNIASGFINAYMSPKVIRDIKNQVFESMGRLSLRYFQNAHTGTLMVRVLNDARRVSSFLVDELSATFINMLTVISTLIIMCKLNLLLAAASVISLPIIIILNGLIRSRIHVLFGKRHRSERELNTAINDNITGARVVKSFGKEEEEIERFKPVNKNVRSIEMSIVVFQNRLNSITSFVQQLSTLLIWSAGAYLILNRGEISYGLLITFAGYVSQLNRPLNQLVSVFRQWVDSMNAAERIFDIIDAKPDIMEKTGVGEGRDIRGEISISHVNFGYEPNILVFKDLNLHVEAGKMLGIVGRSGAGKTTLVNIISRLYDVNEGSIKIDGVDIRDYSFADLRRGIAMVSQETYIFMGTIAENIAYAKPEATRSEIINAAKLASAHDFICRLPEGYDTYIGASGRTLSGGERQRISIARAVLSDPSILILDEATASVDTETERSIQEALTLLTKNRTTLSIAHRLSTLKDADYLVVLEHGEIVEEGTHEELIGKRGTYYKLKELQTNALALKGLE